MLLRKKISAKDAGMYWLFQLIGTFIASALLAVIFGAGGVTDMTGACEWSDGYCRTGACDWP